MQGGKNVCVVMVSDTHYLPMVAALVKSVEANLHQDYLLNLWLVADGISQKRRSLLDESVDKEITTINWVDAGDLPGAKNLPKDFSTFPSNIYLWYFMPYFLPSDLGKVIYMDADMLNCRDLSELWNTNIGNKIAGAVQDPRIRTFDCDWGGILNFQALGLNGNLPYLNSGILLVNLELWRKNDITTKALQYVANNLASAIYPEQYGINLALQNQWLELNPLWNYFASATSINTPYNIHFVDRKPIYLSYKNNPVFRQEFMRYLSNTAWFDFRPISEMRRYRKKLANIMSRIPFWIFRKVKAVVG